MCISANTFRTDLWTTEETFSLPYSYSCLLKRSVHPPDLSTQRWVISFSLASQRRRMPHAPLTCKRSSSSKSKCETCSKWMNFLITLNGGFWQWVRACRSMRALYLRHARWMTTTLCSWARKNPLIAHQQRAQENGSKISFKKAIFGYLESQWRPRPRKALLSHEFDRFP